MDLQPFVSQRFRPKSVRLSSTPGASLKRNHEVNAREIERAIQKWAKSEDEPEKAAERQQALKAVPCDRPRFARGSKRPKT